VKKMNADKEAGSGLSAAQRKELDSFMDLSKNHMERAEKQFERDSKALNSQKDQIRTL
jgi:archaellum component FlaC